MRCSGLGCGMHVRYGIRNGKQQVRWACVWVGFDSPPVFTAWDGSSSGRSPSPLPARMQQAPGSPPEHLPPPPLAVTPTSVPQNTHVHTPNPFHPPFPKPNHLPPPRMRWTT